MGYRPDCETSIGSQYFSELRLGAVSREIKIRLVKGDPDYIVPARTTESIGSQYFSRLSLETIGPEVRIRRPVKVIPTILPLRSQLAGL